MSTYLVTGCAGFVGSHLAEQLLDEGHDVLGVDAFTDYYPRRLKEANLGFARRRSGFWFVEADLAVESPGSFTDGIDGIFHLAAQPGVRGSWGASFAVYLRDNLLVTQRIFEAACARGIRVVFASSSSIYGNAETYPTPEDARPQPRSPYGVTKLCCEHLAQVYRAGFDLDVVALRYFTVYGPRQRPDMAFSKIVSALAEGSPFHLNGTGEQSRDFTYVSDAVSATVAAMERAPAGTAYNVGGGTEATLRTVIEFCEEIGDRRLDVRYEPEAAGDVLRTAADTTRIRTDLDWSPRTSLHEGLAAQLSHRIGSTGLAEHG